MQFYTQQFLENKFEIESRNFVNGLMDIESSNIEEAYSKRGIQVLLFNDDISTYKLYASDFDGHVYLIKDDKECFRSTMDIFYVLSENFFNGSSEDDAFYTNVYLRACFCEVLFQADLFKYFDFPEKSAIDDYICSTLNELYSSTSVKIFNIGDFSDMFFVRLHERKIPRGTVVCKKTRITHEDIHVLPDFLQIYFRSINPVCTMFDYSMFDKAVENIDIFLDSIILIYLYVCGINFAEDKGVLKSFYMDLAEDEEYLSFISEVGKLQSVEF